MAKKSASRTKQPAAAKPKKPRSPEFVISAVFGVGIGDATAKAKRLGSFADGLPAMYEDPSKARTIRDVVTKELARLDKQTQAGAESEQPAE